MASPWGDDIPSDLKAALSNFTKVEAQLEEVWLATARADSGHMFPLDLYMHGVVKRCLSLTAGVRLMLENANLLCARAILRMQIDTAMRIFAAWLAPDPHEFARAIIDGRPVNKLKSRDGHALTDKYLSTELSKKHEWVRRVYERTSGYVHLSESQFMLTVELSGEDRAMQFVIAGHDTHMPVGSFVEVAECFVAATDIVLEFLVGWYFTKENPERAAEMRRQQPHS